MNQKWRFVEHEKGTNRLKLDGLFTSNDLLKLARWLDDDGHPVDRFNRIDVKLSALEMAKPVAKQSD